MTTTPTELDRAMAAAALGGLEDVGDTFDQQADHVAQALAKVRKAARVAQLREAARVLLDRADVIERTE